MRLSKSFKPRTCSICQEEKTTRDFYFNSSTGFYSSWCKPCRLKKDKERYKNNRDVIRERTKKYRKSERGRAYKEKWLNSLGGKITRAICSVPWKDSGITREDLKQVLEQTFDKNNKTVICYLCSDEISVGGCHIDHVIPKSKGGLTKASNLKVACSTCNFLKRDLTLEDLKDQMMKILDNMGEI